MAAFGDLSALTTMMAEAQQKETERAEMSARGPGQSIKVIMPADRIKLDADKATENKKTAKDPNDIWDEEEIASKDPDFENDGRAVPEFSINYKQAVGSGDVYLGLGGVTPSTIDAGFIVIRVEFPGEILKDLDLKVEKQKIVAQSPKFRLCTYLPHKVREDDGKAEYDSKTETLKVTLPIIRDGLF